MATLKIGVKRPKDQRGTWLAQLVERATPDLRVVNSSPVLGIEIKNNLKTTTLDFISLIQQFPKFFFYIPKIFLRRLRGFGGFCFVFKIYLRNSKSQSQRAQREREKQTPH